MGTQVLLAVLCCLTLCKALEADTTAKSSEIKDNVSEESAPRLYQNVPVYASAAPYPGVTYRFPAFASGLLPAASRVIPVKEHLVLHNANGYLKDSYGNRFVGTPQSGAYKAIPQQFVPLQELPAHLMKPIAVSGPNYQIKQFAPQISFGHQFRIPTLQAAAPTPLNHFTGSSHPFIGYAQNIKSIAQSPAHTQQLQAPQQQSTSNAAVYADTHSAEKYGNYKSEPKFQRLEEKPFTSYGNVPAEKDSKFKQEIIHEKSQIKASPDTQTYTAIVNGKKTVIELETNPSVPLLDLTLLEPLTFDNPSPVVPQIAQFLPKINQATYKKLPEFHKQHRSNKGHKIQGDVEIIKGVQKNKPKKKPKKPVVYQDDTTLLKIPVEPTITFKGKPNESPEFSYEINAPNYKETYKEQTVKYNKETNMDPVSYSYNHKEEKDPVTYSYEKTVQKEPVHYSYVSDSSDPGHAKGAQHHSNEQPKHLVYTLKPEEHRENEEQNNGPEHPHPPQRDSSENNSAEETDDDGRPHQEAQYHENSRETPGHHQHHDYQEHPRPQNVEHRQRPHERHHSDKHTHHPHHEQRHYHEQHPHHQEHSHHEGRPQHIENSGPFEGSHEERPQNIEHSPPQHDRPPQSFQPLKAPIQHEQEIQPITYEYEEDIRLLPSPSPAAIQVDPNQHVQREEQHQSPHPSPHPHLHHNNENFASQPRHPNHHEHQISYGPAPSPFVHEKSKRIIIQEETPDEMHSHREQMVAEMLEQEENNEEDFENAYKNAAVGFPAFYKKAEDIEKHIYNPESYGEARAQSFTLEDRPFEQYTAEGDGFPKSARLTYKDESENNKEDYFLDYAVNKPTSLRDRHQKKKEYYKLYDSYKPDKFFGEEKKQKSNEKYTVAPSFAYVADPEPKKTSYFAQYKAAPVKFAYNFNKQSPRDTSAFASRPFQSYTRKTNFVEPQFQYGFEPIGLPRLFDSELAAMASNDSPESEKPAMRKKIYKENWYIKKTRTAGGDAS